MKHKMMSAIGIGIGLAAATAALADEGGGSKSNVLLKATTSWNGIRYRAYPTGQPQLTTVRMTIPAHSSLHWHKHLMPNSAYILSGSLTVEEKSTGRKATYHAGEAFAESVDNVHRGSTADEEAVVIVTYASTSGQPLSVPVTDNE